MRCLFHLKRVVKLREVMVDIGVGAVDIHFLCTVAAREASLENTETARILRYLFGILTARKILGLLLICCSSSQRLRQDVTVIVALLRVNVQVMVGFFGAFSSGYHLI